MKTLALALAAAAIDIDRLDGGLPGEGQQGGGHRQVVVAVGQHGTQEQGLG